MNQSEFLAITCKSLKVREKSRGQGEIAFGFASHWLENWRESVAINRNHIITFDRHLKTRMDTAIHTLNNLGQISNEEEFTVRKVPTHSEYLIENDSVGPPATQKISKIVRIINAEFDT